MLSMTEKIIMLKTVSIFSETPDQTLAEVAQILEEVSLPAQTTVVTQGEIGTSMYIVVQGKVRVHNGDHTLNQLGAWSVFGEMAALDRVPQARIASVTTTEDTLLFRLDQQPLFEIMDRDMDVVRGIIHVLCQNLRERARDMAEDYAYIQQFNRVTAAAAAVEAGIFQPETIDEVAQRSDALGQLARVFQRMTREVQAREQRLQQQVRELTIVIDQRDKDRQVAAITETDYFRELKNKAKQLKNRR